MKWENDDLDILQLHSEVSTLLEVALERCAAIKADSVSALALLYPLFGDDVPRGLTDEGKDNWKHAKQIFFNAFLLADYTAGFCMEYIKESTIAIASEINPFDKSTWKPYAADVIISLSPEDGLLAFIQALLKSMGECTDFDIKGFLEMFDMKRLMRAFVQTSEISVFIDKKEINTNALTAGAYDALAEAIDFSNKSGVECCDLPQLLYGLLKDPDGYVSLILSKATGVNSDTFSIRERIRTLFMNFNKDAKQLHLSAEYVSDSLKSLLDEAAKAAESFGEARIDERQLFLRMLYKKDAGVRNLLEKHLMWDLQEIISLAENTKWNPLYVGLPASICDCRNLSLEASNATLCSRAGDVQDVAQKLLVHQRVLLHGETGVGKTTLASLLALYFSSEKSVEARQSTPIVYMDAFRIEKAELETKASHLFSYMETHPRPIYVIDSFGKMLAASWEMCCQRLSRANYRILAIVDSTDETLLNKETELRKVFCIHRLNETESDQVKEIAEMRSKKLELGYRIKFTDNVLSDTVRMARDYLLSRREPKRTVDLLELAIRWVKEKADSDGKTAEFVTTKDVARQIAEETTLPVEMILGAGQDKDYKSMLTRSLIGQERAVEKVADRLDLIQSGEIEDKDLPKAVFLFAGLSGTGKTELAKQIASLYSASHSLITYQMNSYMHSQDVSRLIGSAPGLVGYEKGGLLINDLNREPYSVVLLDEVEKADPSIWSSFLGLFDQGFITDGRGIKAYSNKAFFVLTSNVGQYDIARMIKEGRNNDEIEELIKSKIGEEKHVIQSNQNCFSPEFIGRVLRLGGIVIFDSLGAEALNGIASKMVRSYTAFYQERHQNRKLIIDEAVARAIAERIFEENNDALFNQKGKYAGARPMYALFDEWVKLPLVKNAKLYKDAVGINIFMDGGKPAIIPVTEDNMHKIETKQRDNIIERLSMRLERIGGIGDEQLELLPSDKLLRIDSLLSEAGLIAGV